MKRLNRVTNLFLFGFPIIIFTSSLQLGVGSPQNRRPGFLTFLASALLFSLVFFAMIRETKPSFNEKASLISLEKSLKGVNLILVRSTHAFCFQIMVHIIISFLLILWYFPFMIAKGRSYYYTTCFDFYNQLGIFFSLDIL